MAEKHRSWKMFFIQFDLNESNQREYILLFLVFQSIHLRLNGVGLSVQISSTLCAEKRSSVVDYTSKLGNLCFEFALM